MNSVENFIQELQRHEIHLALVGDELEVDYPICEFDFALVEQIKQHEAALIAHLRAMQAGSHALAPDLLASPSANLASHAQQRLWFIDQLEGASTQYHLPVAIHVSGPLQRAAVAQALTSIVTRHEVLRSSFRLHNGQLESVLHPSSALLIKEISAPTFEDADAQQAWLTQCISEEASRRFDLAQDVMLRASLIALPGTTALEENVILVTLHHIAADGWSVGVLIKEFSELYYAYCNAGQGAALTVLPNLPLQYAQYAQWQKQRLQGPLLAQQMQYWQQHLQALPQVHSLPLDHKRPTQQDFTAALHKLSIPAALTTRLRALARAQGTTLFVLLQACFAALVAARSGESDVVMGVPIAGRSHLELESLIGFFVNTLIFRSRPRSELSFSDFLQTSHEHALAAYEHQDVGFEMLVDQLQPVRSSSYAPLFQILFSLQKSHVQSLSLPGLNLRRLENPFKRSKCDLEVEITEGEQSLEMNWLYANSLWQGATIARMSAHFVAVLQRACDNPAQALWQLTALPDAELQQIRTWNATAQAFPASDTLISLFERSAAQSPQNTALVFGQHRISYAELNQRANQLAHYLIAQGVQPGDLVGHCVERSLAMVIALLAIMKAGAAYVALETSLPTERLHYMLGDSGCKLVLTQQHLVPRLTGFAQQVVLLEELPGNAPYDAFPQHNPATLCHAASLAYVIYTSGSTGQPKGTLNLQRAVCNRLHAMQQQFALGQQDRLLQKTPLSFDVSVWEIFWPLATGACLVLAKPEGHKDPHYLLEILQSEAITTTHFVPSMLQMFVRAVDGQRLPALRYLMTSGEALSYSLQQACQQAFPGVHLANHYGPTETAIEVSYWCFSESRADQLVPIGHPIANTQLHVLGPQGQVQPIGVAGELYIGGVQVGEGYLGQAELTAQRFVTLEVDGRAQRLYRTGDLVRWLAEGEIDYLGRLDNQIKLRGMRLELGEIETALRAQALIKDAVVVLDNSQSSPGNTDQQRLVAYLVWQNAPQDEATALQAVRHTLAQTLPAYMLPSLFQVLRQLPISPNGKIDWQALPKPQASIMHSVDRQVVAASTPSERQIAEVWSRHLQLPLTQLSMQDNFFEIGGNSMLSILVQEDLRKAGHASLSIADLFQFPSIAQLSKHLDQQQTLQQASERQNSSPPAAAPRAEVLTSAKARMLNARARQRQA